MALFRFHRGQLSDSIKTSIIVSTTADLLDVIYAHNPINVDWEIKLSIKAYPSINDCFDKRIGWYTHIVTANCLEENSEHVVGFLSESL